MNIEPHAFELLEIYNNKFNYQRNSGIIILSIIKIYFLKKKF